MQTAYPETLTLNLFIWQYLKAKQQDTSFLWMK
jgi:hypothetical protein